jgi:Secretion system C-terminal sorting domain
MKGLFDDENNALDSLGKIDGLQLIYGIQKEGIKIYPNPTSEQITIKYNLKRMESGLLIFYDLTGREQTRITLSNKSNIVLSNISQLNNGVYTYKYYVNNSVRETGKLSVIK